MKLALLVAATVTALSAPAASAQTLEAWYRLDEMSGPTAVDWAGNGHDGTYDGGTLGQPGATPGTGTSVEFDGLNDKVDIPDGPGFTSLRKELSALCWMRADQLSGVQRFFGNDGSWTWGVVNSSIRFTTRTILDYDQPAGLTTGVWYHVAVVFDSSFDVHFYLDGQKIGVINGSAQANAPFPDWHIAYKDPGAPEWFDGHLDDIQVYDGVLSDAQVKFLFDNPGKSLGGPVGTNYCGPANKNSMGTSAVISGFGNATLALNDLTLSASGMPMNEMGYFITSMNQGFKPFAGGSQGNLCIANPAGRFRNQVQSTGSGGEFSIPVDLFDLPLWPHVSAQVGETWHFQAWYTDLTSSNFTDGLVITFL